MGKHALNKRDIWDTRLQLKIWPIRERNIRLRLPQLVEANQSRYV